MSNLVVCIVWFSLLYFGTFYVFRKDDLFSPIKFVTAIFILRNLPYLVAIYLDNSLFPDYVLTSIGLTLEDAIPKYTLVQTIAFISLIIGIKFFKRNRVYMNSLQLKDYKGINYSSFVLLGIGMIGYLFFLNQIGGILTLLENLNNRIELQSGAYSLTLMKLLSFAMLFRFQLYSFKRTKRNKILFWFFFIVAVLTSSSLGGRRGTFFIILLIIAGHHFYFNRIVFQRIKKSTFIILFLALSIYTFFIPALRSPGGFERIINGEEDLVEQINVGDLVGYFSYTYIDIFTVNYFDKNNKWNYSSLWTIPQNLNIFKNRELRPPVDEGVYFYNIARYGLEFTPPTARNKMHIVSLPIENFGFGYANGLIVGVIFSFFLLGIVYKMVYDLFLASNLSPIGLYIYLFTLFTFNFSSLRIMNSIYIFLNVLIALIVYRVIVSFRN